MTDDIEVMRRCAHREELDTNIGCNRGSCQIIYITFEKSFDISSRQLREATPSFTHLLIYLVIYKSMKILEVAVHVVVAW